MQVYEYENTGTNSLEPDAGIELARFSVLYTRVSTRKHKKWEGDGVLICYSNLALLKTEDEKDVISRSTSVKRIDDLEDGKEFKMGVWEVQIQERIAQKPSNLNQTLSHGDKSVTLSHETAPVELKRKTRSPLCEQPQPKIAPTQPHFQRGDSLTSRSKFRCPLLEPQTSADEPPPFIINEDRVEEYGEEAVIGDTFISRHLREHQKDGVRFIFSNLQNEKGVILADEMGLGKSIQTITATLALMRQPKSTRYGLKKCLLVVPSSLVNNWKSEFRKWFCVGRTPVIVAVKPSDITTYPCSYQTYPYLVISYEMALRYIDKLISVRFDILVCDEGHRLKNINSKLRLALDSLAVTRRLLLTGTPLQNDVEEFYSLLDFIRPTKFGSLAEFKARCRKEDEEWSAMIADCVLRRTAEINNAHLPVKNDYILFCAPSTVQKCVLNAICMHITGEPLVLIDMMRKTANHPAILYKKLSKNVTENCRVDYSPLLSAFPKNYGERPARLADSGKLAVFVEMMASFRQNGECAVVVSNFTKTLDMLASLCSSLGLCVIRLDGQTPVSDRHALVTKFNAERDPENVFLLSTKAGGVGLNLIGASRLILFDSDWNPASDLQAMARIWRDGQTRPCHIYRLVTAGTIDEKILQRQVKKTGLSSIISLNDQSSKSTFLDEDLEDIFSVKESLCETHELLNCQCGGMGLLLTEMEEEACDENEESLFVHEKCEEDDFERNEQEFKATDSSASSVVDEPATMAELFRWRHYSPEHTETWDYFKSVAGFSETSLNDLTFAFHLSSKF
ncbi:unnamed protein product [Cylicocyclus nassatus]|uniref:DNA repair and recombination protein RAD54-like n=1 Tax=Cylicocyclus nassatus TaxID=53992 RepID=A0AA36H241_CYLNA|nr:unnamed protein product [Cylicocyclus nassatus]